MFTAGDQGRRLGRYVVKTYGEESVRAFVPPALPPDPPLRLAPLERLLEEANRSLGTLDGLASALPDLSLFIYAYVRKEAVLSSQIEGTQSSLSDLLLFENNAVTLVASWSREESMRQTDERRRAFLKSGGLAAASLVAGAAPVAAQPAAPAGVQRGMPTRNLGKTGYQVGIFSLGGQAALERTNNDAVAVPIVERALDLGINYIDTSSIYGGPERPSERYIGQVLKRRRKEAFVATKTKERTRDASLRMIEQSLKLLQTDHVDLWQLHDIGTMADVNEVFAKGGAMEALEQAREQKMVRFLGVTGHHRADALMECIRRFAFETVLMGINAADHHAHSFSAELLPLALERQMGIIGMKVPARGRILASWTPPPVDRQKRMWEGGANVTTTPGALTMREAMYWVLSQPVSTIIIGIDTVAQLEENVALAREFTPYSAPQLAAISEKTRPIAAQALWFRNFDRT